MQKFEKPNAIKQQSAAHVSSTVQRHGDSIVDNRDSTSQLMDTFQPVQRQPNKTGIPDNLKSGMENLSGMSLDHVKVHYNSSKPASVQAHAMAQGHEIHLSSGQEKHLPHELGHVVQQAQGRVQPTTTVAGMNVNDNPSLEKEADDMGGKALQRMANNASQSKCWLPSVAVHSSISQRLLQRKTDIHLTKGNFTYKHMQQPAGIRMDAMLDPFDPIKGTGTPTAAGVYALLNTDFKRTFVQGHLLNDNLGGRGEYDNLYPITYAANTDHKDNVEAHVKTKLLNLKTGKDYNKDDLTKELHYAGWGSYRDTHSKTGKDDYGKDSRLNTYGNSYGKHISTKPGLSSRTAVSSVAAGIAGGIVGGYAGSMLGATTGSISGAITGGGLGHELGSRYFGKAGGVVGGILGGIGGGFLGSTLGGITGTVKGVGVGAALGGATGAVIAEKTKPRLRYIVNVTNRANKLIDDSPECTFACSWQEYRGDKTVGNEAKYNVKSNH